VALDDRRHPDAEQLAEYADGVLGADVRAEVEEHLVDCAACRTVLAETMAFVGTEWVGRRTMGAVSGRRVVPFRKRRWATGAVTGLATAAALVRRLCCPGRHRCLDHRSRPST
jgi:anti-sigma factor RsiW